MYTDINSLKINGECFQNEKAPQKMFELKGLLCDRFNIVFGRNGSDKTTVGRAIQFIAEETADGSNGLKKTSCKATRTMHTIHSNMRTSCKTPEAIYNDSIDTHTLDRKESLNPQKQRLLTYSGPTIISEGHAI